jgi:hypothetical protein
MKTKKEYAEEALTAINTAIQQCEVQTDDGPYRKVWERKQLEKIRDDLHSLIKWL